MLFIRSLKLDKKKYLVEKRNTTSFKQIDALNKQKIDI